MVCPLLAVYERRPGDHAADYRVCVARRHGALCRGIVSLDETILCMLLAMAIVSSLQTMMEFMENLSIVMEVVPQVQAVLALPELPFTSESQRPQHSDVVLEDVHFSYEAGRETIHGVSLTAPAGSVTALVGPSGSGKSTLARLIARYWDVAQGAVKIGGVDVRQMSWMC